MNWIPAGTFPGLGQPWWPLAAAVLGLAAGRLANFAIRYLPLSESFESSTGWCASCGARGGPSDLLAITSWLAQGGRCRRCRARLSSVPAAVEVLNTLLWALMAARRPPSVLAAILMLFITALLALIVIDFQHFLLPDAITLPGIVVGVAATQLRGWPVSLVDSALSAGVGYFAMMALAKAAELYYREEALGQGDWKLVAMLGAVLGSTKAIATVLVANGAGAVFGLLLVATLGERGRQKLPLGSFLGASGILMAFL